MIDFVSRRLSESVMLVEVSGGRMSEMERKYFFDCVGDMIDSGIKHVVIECHKLGHLNSSGLAAILAARKRAAKKGGRIYLTHLSSAITELIELTKLGRILSVYPTTEDAISNINEEMVVIG